MKSLVIGLSVALSAAALYLVACSSDDGPKGVIPGAGGGDTDASDVSDAGDDSTPGSGGGNPGGSGSGGAPGGGTPFPQDQFGLLTNVSFHTDYIVDITQYSGNDAINAAINEHLEVYQTGGAFVGSYLPIGGKPIPPAGTQSLTYGIRNTNQGTSFLLLAQESQTAAATAEPLVRIEMDVSKAIVGPMVLGNDGWVVVYHLVGPSDLCVMAIGLGTLEITAAEPTEGGEIAISGTNIQLYHPSDTPYGDLGVDDACPVPLAP